MAIQKPEKHDPVAAAQICLAELWQMNGDVLVSHKA